MHGGVRDSSLRGVVNKYRSIVMTAEGETFQKKFLRANEPNRRAVVRVANQNRTVAVVAQ